jgi:hypothetical protein
MATPHHVLDKLSLLTFEPLSTTCSMCGKVAHIAYYRPIRGSTIVRFGLCVCYTPQHEQESVIEAEPGMEPAPAPPRQRRKKIPETVMEDPELGVNVSLDDSGEASSEKIDAREGISSAKPKRIRRIEEPKPKR